MEIQRLREEYDKLRSALNVTAPFISSLLRKVRIIMTRSVPYASVNSLGVMCLNPDFWEKLDLKDKAFILGHEVMHPAFGDLKRFGTRDRHLMNICQDAVNNTLLLEMIRCSQALEEFCWTGDKVHQMFRDEFTAMGLNAKDVREMAKEELYRALAKIIPQVPQQAPGCPKCGGGNIVCKRLTIKADGSFKGEMRCEDCGEEWTTEGEAGGRGGGKPIPVEEVVFEGAAQDVGVGDLEGEILQEGAPEINDADEETREELWRHEVSKAYTAQKTAGKVPASMKRLVEELLSAKVNWKTLLHGAFRFGFGRIVVSTYVRPSRKHPNFPGQRRFTVPTVHFLADMSGSMSGEETAQSIGEVYAIARICVVKVTAWDATAYEEITAKNPQEVIDKVMKRLRGGGGTVIAPCLRKTLTRMRFRDIVVVFTDGYIYDADEEETKRLFAEVAAKSAAAIFVTTNKEHELPQWRLVKVKANGG